MLAKKNAYLDSAYQHLQVISQDEQKRMEYEARQKAILDYNQGMLEAEERGIEKGRAEGMAEAIFRLLKVMPPEQVAQALQIPLEEILRIRDTRV